MLAALENDELARFFPEETRHSESASEDADADLRRGEWYRTSLSSIVTACSLDALIFLS